MQTLLDCMRNRCCGYRRQWEPQGPMVPTVWWYMNTTIPTLQKRRAAHSDGIESTPKKFFGTWNEFESVLAGNSSGNQGSINIVDSIIPLLKH